MKRLLFIPALFLASSAGAFAQYAYTTTSIYETSGTIYASTYLEIDYESSQYYSLAMWNEFDECNYSNCEYSTNGVSYGWAYGASSVSWSASAPITQTFYTVWAEPELLAYYYYYYDGCGCNVYEDDYGYSLIDDDGSPDIYESAPCVYEGVYTDIIPLGAAWLVADATYNPPYISALQIWSGETGPGGSGFFVLWGNDLFDVYGPTSASVDCSGVGVSIAYNSPGQINLSYSVGGSVPPEPCNVWASTPYGAASIPIDVGFPFTDVQHNYPAQPFGTSACRITSWFDATAGRIAAHHAIDVVQANSAGNQVVPATGTPVYAIEGGTVVVSASQYGPQPYPACMNYSPRPQGNYVKIQGSDGYFTIYMHMTPIVSVNQVVTQGQEIGTIDSSGCQSAHHVHVARKDSSNNAVNFVIPGCVNSPTPFNWYDDPEGAVYDNDDDADS